MMEKCHAWYWCVTCTLCQAARSVISGRCLSYTRWAAAPGSPAGVRTTDNKATHSCFHQNWSPKLNLCTDMSPFTNIDPQSRIISLISRIMVIAHTVCLCLMTSENGGMICSCDVCQIHQRTDEKPIRGL